MKKFVSNSRQKVRKNSGFTLIEILVVIGIIAILAAIVIIAINPARQFAQARNSQRTSNVEAILNAVGQRMADHKGLFRDTTETVCLGDITTATSTIGIGAGTPAEGSFIDLRPCLVPTYMAELPTDPTLGIPLSGATYNTAYTIAKDAVTGRITVGAPAATSTSELSQTISLTR